MPQPIAGPFTAAMTGLSHSRAAMAAGVGLWRTTGEVGTGLAGGGAARISRTSSPEQNAGSVPVTITQRASGSLTARRKATAPAGRRLRR